MEGQRSTCKIRRTVQEQEDNNTTRNCIYWNAHPSSFATAADTVLAAEAATTAFSSRSFNEFSWLCSRSRMRCNSCFHLSMHKVFINPVLSNAILVTGHKNTRRWSVWSHPMQMVLILCRSKHFHDKNLDQQRNRCNSCAQPWKYDTYVESLAAHADHTPFSLVEKIFHAPVPLLQTRQRLLPPITTHMKPEWKSCLVQSKYSS